MEPSPQDRPVTALPASELSATGRDTVPVTEVASRPSHRIVLTGLTVSSMVVAGFTLWNYPLTVIGVPALLALGYRYPELTLMLAIGWLVSTNSLSGGDHWTRHLAAFGASDLLFAAALPGLWRQYRRHNARPIFFPPFALPALLFTACGVLSYLMNLHAMRGDAGYYLIGLLRTVQIVALLPLCYSMPAWSRGQVRLTGGLYLLGTLMLALIVLGTFRPDGVYRNEVAGNHKNMAGLILSCGALICLSLSAPRERPGNRHIPLAGALLIALALGTLLARSSVLSLAAGATCIATMRRRAGACASVVGLALATTLLCQHLVRFPVPDSQRNPSLRGRVQQWESSVASIRQHWLFGDGFRARRDYNPHNLFLVVLTENGVVGMAVFLWLMGAQIRLFLQVWRAHQSDADLETLCVALIACWVALLVHAQFDPFWRRGPLWIPWAGTGMLLRLHFQKSPQNLS
ncbi:MAG: O-antigen ligase family protein [Chloroherpetonaceae bacterium]|nr:O-antigen ligase family protein [Chthonomonadaceae bacterium]MDW8206661.1 O-antigen ligase family protein [Chloroherpetonaceae bacterium]